MSTRRTRCGKCDGCLAVECRKCKHCLDMKKNGGPGNLRRPCVDRVCRAIQAAPTKKDTSTLPSMYGPVSYTHLTLPTKA